MNRARTSILFVILLLSLAPATFAKEFYESYDDGIKAVKAKNWDVVIQKMTEAIAANGNENNRARSYGTNFFPYHPFYYRGIAYYNKNQLEKAIEDFGRATGPGEVALGSVESWTGRVETRMALAQQNPNMNPPPVTQTTAPPPPVNPPTRTVPNNPPPVTPPTRTVPNNPPPISVDPAIATARARAESLMRSANDRMSSARSARAETRAQAEYSQGQQLVIEARSKATAADSAAEWLQVANTADRAVRTFDAAINKAKIAASNDTSTPAVAADDVLRMTKTNLQKALDLYFNGQFQESASEFEKLTRDQSKNAMVWAFLGASRYYAYLLDGELDPGGKKGAEEAFRKARKLKPSLDLSAKYFSPRIRKFYASTE